MAVKLSLILLLIFHLIVPSTLLAQENSSSNLEQGNPQLELVPFPNRLRLEINDELQFWLKKNKPAPFSGVLLNPEAVALILSEYRAQKERALAAIEQQRNADSAVLQLQTGRLQVEIESVNKKSKIRSDAQEAENKRLFSINKDLREDKSSFWDDLLLVGAGTGVGFLVGALVVSLANSSSN